MYRIRDQYGWVKRVWFTKPCWLSMFFHRWNRPEILSIRSYDTSQVGRYAMFSVLWEGQIERRSRKSWLTRPQWYIWKECSWITCEPSSMVCKQFSGFSMEPPPVLPLRFFLCHCCVKLDWGASVLWASTEVSSLNMSRVCLPNGNFAPCALV